MSAIRSASSTTAMLTSARLDLAPLDEIFEPTGTSHQDVDGSSQRPQLGAVTGAAVDSRDGELAGPGERTEHAAHLRGQFPGRHEDETSGTACPGPRTAGGEGLCHRDRESESLARTRWRPARDVPAGERVRQRRRLDRERCCDAVARQQGDDVSGHAKIGECGWQEDSSQL